MKKLFTLAMICFIAASVEAKIYYVTNTATTVATAGIACDWNNPVTLASITSIATTATDSIWVKAGTYYVDRTATANRAAIFINSGVKQIYGGFAGSESSLSQRLRTDLDGNGIIEPWEFTNQTIFDGTNISDYTVAVTSRKEIYQTGTPTTTGLSILTPNKKTVISFEGGASHILDGVVVQNGKYDGDSYGSGINLTVATTVRNCIVRKCFSTRQFDLTNGASISAGAAILVFSPLATIDGCLIEGNTAGPLLPGSYTSGAGVCLSQGTLSNSVVRNNISYVRSATAAGVGFAAGELTALGLTFTINTAQNGILRAAGVYMSGNAINKRAPLVINCLIANNEGISYDPNSTGATVYGAGVTIDAAGVIINSTIVNNKMSFATLNTSNAIPTAALEGIGIYMRSGTPYTTTTPALSKYNIASIYNCIVLGNQGNAATLDTKADISVKTNVAYAPNEASTAVTNASTLQPFNIMDVKNCIVGGASINCDPLGSTGTVVGNNGVLSASITFATNQKTMTQTVPSNCVYSQTTAIFNNPNSVAGSSETDPTIKTANWRLKDGTFISSGAIVNTSWINYSATNVGTTYVYNSPTTDLIGNAQGTTPSIGALLNSGGGVYTADSKIVSTEKQAIISTHKNMIRIVGLERGSLVTIVGIDGRMISNQISKSTSMEIPAKGFVIVKVDTGNNSQITKLIVQ